MAETVKILGQVDLTATTLTDVYTVPTGKSASLSRVFLTNRTGAPIDVRLAIAVAGAADNDKQYVEYSLTDSRQTLANGGITMSATDVLRAYASATGVSVNVLGVETDWRAPKVLGQLAPSANSLSDLYTVPSGKSAVVSKLQIANRSSTVPALIRVAVAPAGAASADKHYLIYDHPIEGTHSFELSGLTLAATDVLRVYASSANISFNAFGTEEP